MAVITPTDRPKSVCNRCLIVMVEFCVVTLLFGIFCWCKGFCHMAESYLYLFLHMCLATTSKVNISGNLDSLTILTEEELCLPWVESSCRNFPAVSLSR